MSDETPRIIVPFPAPLQALAVANGIRSTLLASSLQSLKTRGHLERYKELLPTEHHEALLNCVAGQWFPLELGAAHYTACDALGLSAEQQLEIGSDVSRRVHETFLGVMLQMAKGVGVTPWTLLPKGNQVYGRIMRGGGLQITRLGPKDARIEIARLPLLTIPYFRVATQGIYQTAVGMFAKRAHVRVVAAESRAPGILTTLHASWV